MDGLADAFAQVHECFSNPNQLQFERCIQAVRKFFGVAVIASFAACPWILEDSVNAVKEQVLQPLVMEMSRRGGKQGSDLVIMYLDVTTAIVGTVAGSVPLGNMKSPLRLGWVEHLARLCYKEFDYAWQSFRLFDWLATYLSRCYGIEEITPAILRAAAGESEEHGKPFELPGRWS